MNTLAFLLGVLTVSMAVGAGLSMGILGVIVAFWWLISRSS